MQFKPRRCLAILVGVVMMTTGVGMLYLHFMPNRVNHRQPEAEASHHDALSLNVGSSDHAEPCPRFGGNGPEQQDEQLGALLSKIPKYQTSRSPRIPHIIHQIWNLDSVPYALEEAIRSWQEQHPTWQHWVWTMDDGYQLMETAYSPEYLTLFRSYGSDTFRTDALRLFVLHTFGGVYADIDMQCLKPLDAWTYEHECILTEEPHEHTFVVSERVEANVVNGFMACAPRHPFLQSAIVSLHTAARHHYDNYLRATGPLFLDDVHQKYCFAARKLGRSAEARETVTVVAPEYFLPTYDPSVEGILSQKCSPSHQKRLMPAGRDVCRSLWRRDYRNEARRESFTIHKWMNLFGEYPNWKMRNSVPLSEVLGTRTNVSVKMHVAKFLHRTNTTIV